MSYSQPTHQPLSQRKSWAIARQAVFNALQSELTGKHWIQLSCDDKPLIQPASKPHSMLVEVVDVKASASQDADRRLTRFASHSAQGIICDNLMQTHPQPHRLINEIKTLIRPGGWLLVCGAGSSLGKQALNVPQNSISPQAINKLLKDSTLKLQHCYSHPRQQPAAWQQRLNSLQLSLAKQLAQQLPSLLPLMVRYANTQAGWVLFFKDQTLATTNASSPLKLQARKFQINSAISLREQTKLSAPSSRSRTPNNTAPLPTRAA